MLTYLKTRIAHRNCNFGHEILEILMLQRGRPPSDQHLPAGHRTENRAIHNDRCVLAALLNEKARQVSLRICCSR